MASVACVVFGHSRIPLKPGKAGHFGYFDCEVQLDSIVAKPFGVISGRVVVDTSNEIKCFGIRVQLDANVNLKFETKMDNRVSSHKKIESVLKNASDPDGAYYITSPFRVQLSGDESDRKLKSCDLQKGSHNFSFSLKIPGETLPSPFKSPYGNLQYKIVAYMRSYHCYVQIAEKPVTFRGYNNLREQPDALQPLRSESSFQKSIFSSKKVITAVLTADKSGFLIGESLIFKLIISNPKCFTVRKANVNLVRRIIFDVNGATKSTISTLDTCEINNISKDETMTLSGQLTIPKTSIPTYTVKKVYSVIHLIQYQITIADYSGPLKGQAEITVGTTNEPVEIIMNRRMSLLQIDDQFAISRRRQRSDSISSRLSDSSVMSTLSLPPNYSQLSSRAVSLMSFETLPPHYDDVK